MIEKVLDLLAAKSCVQSVTKKLFLMVLAGRGWLLILQAAKIKRGWKEREAAVLVSCREY